MRLLLIRHGQTPSNVAGLLDSGAPGPGLTELGRRQAAAVPAALAGRDLDALFVSNLVRTGMTMAPLAQERGLEPTVLPGLREVESGRLEMASDEASHRAYLGTVFQWAHGDLDARMPGGPDGHEFFARYDDAVARIAATGAASAALVSHGAAIRAWAGLRARGVDPHRLERTALSNTGWFDLEGDPESGWDVVDWSADPLGGPGLKAPAAEDPTGDSAG